MISSLKKVCFLAEPLSAKSDQLGSATGEHFLFSQLLNFSVLCESFLGRQSLLSMWNWLAISLSLRLFLKAGFGYQHCKF